MFKDHKDYVTEALNRLKDKKAIENDIAKIIATTSEATEFLPVGYNIKSHRFEKMTDDYDPFGFNTPDNVNLVDYVLPARVMNKGLDYDTFKDVIIQKKQELQKLVDNNDIVSLADELIDRNVSPMDISYNEFVKIFSEPIKLGSERFNGLEYVVSTIGDKKLSDELIQKGMLEFTTDPIDGYSTEQLSRSKQGIKDLVDSIQRMPSMPKDDVSRLSDLGDELQEIADEQIAKNSQRDSEINSFTKSESNPSNLKERLIDLKNRWADDLEEYKEQHETVSIDEVVEIGDILKVGNFFLRKLDMTFKYADDDPENAKDAINWLYDYFNCLSMIDVDKKFSSIEDKFKYLNSGNIDEIKSKNFIEAIEDSDFVDIALSDDRMDDVEL